MSKSQETVVFKVRDPSIKISINIVVGKKEIGLLNPIFFSVHKKFEILIDNLIICLNKYCLRLQLDLQHLITMNSKVQTRSNVCVMVSNATSVSLDSFQF